MAGYYNDAGMTGIGRWLRQLLGGMTAPIGSSTPGVGGIGPSPIPMPTPESFQAKGLRRPPPEYMGPWDPNGAPGMPTPGPAGMPMGLRKGGDIALPRGGGRRRRPALPALPSETGLGDQSFGSAVDLTPPELQGSPIPGAGGGGFGLTTMPSVEESGFQPDAQKKRSALIKALTLGIVR